MAGYSSTALPKKLGCKPGQRLLLVNAPKDFATTLGELPEGVTVATRARGASPFDVIVGFFELERVLGQRFVELAARLDPSGGLWIAWPKRASKQPTDLDEHGVRAIGLDAGLVDNKVCAIDEVWSGLRFVVRLADRKKK